MPACGSTEALARLALCRRLEARRVPFEDEIALGSDPYTLTTTINRSSKNFQATLEMLKGWIRESFTQRE